ncbi:TatD family deoxyribonuclease [Treponema phagedenis]|uniref:Hydrolase, TatD family n=1 Tax=Treponema phagedenis TaxID=162 RepID=A0A0B7GWD9_TREPH|nr:TatD family hydrolase [Treponema phagedenis]NVP25489.1 TatD family hydrolase [Treponema phagedenis]QEJ93966.1 TatD family deoxyribonuclease [Treponema phagedenis]QEJ96712.1 TatD family deoxyribonuclease [Treponema phagedenis]QEJ96872.1 TatD family deoxyribonuclease [Treponema phagedenis]QEK02026.1 TatD family deoxyribonuclease [Treponema phagedenis]
MYSDAHMHIFDLQQRQKAPFSLPDDLRVCTSAHEREEFLFHEKIKQMQEAVTDVPVRNRIILSFGIHPQLPIQNELDFLEKLLKEKRIAAIGECGFDLFTDEYKDTIEQQKAVWNAQLELALFYRTPIVIHVRRAMNLLFAETNLLKKLPAVIFHGWSGSIVEAESFLKKGVPAFFSIGKALLRGQKTVREAATHLPITHILTETDSPYMTLKGEAFSTVDDIRLVFSRLAELREIKLQTERFFELKNIIEENFFKAFALKA